jgi:ABC-type phosphate transport system substrate-binding protein
MKHIKLLMLNVLILVSLPALCWAESVVIVHPSNTVAALEQKQVQRIFLGKTKSFPEGDEAIPINQPEDTAITQSFAKQVLKKTPSQLKSYWTKLLFTGGGAPPKEVGSDAEVVALVSANPNVIGFVDSASINDSVKVVFKF